MEEGPKQDETTHQMAVTVHLVAVVVHAINQDSAVEVADFLMGLMVKDAVVRPSREVVDGTHKQQR